MEIALMIEGQEDVTWDDWVAIAEACERSGIGTLFRSDHYLSVEDKRERGSLDAWASLAALAAVTEKLRLGTMVSPATFRHPSVFAKLAATVDQISGGRVSPGLGAGWWDREHEAYGFDLPELGPRMEAFEEQLEIATRSWADGAFSFSGEHFRVELLDAQPKPVQRPMPLVIGGSGGPRSLRIAARWASEYNTTQGTPAELADLRRRLDAACAKADRDPASLPLSLMTTWIVAETREGVLDYASRLSVWQGKGGDGERLLDEAPGFWIVGTVDEAVEQLRALAEAGVTRVMAQHLLHRDIEAIELIGREVAPLIERF
ncbi:MAG TPA: TIGR03560 family F420-dependent LLM class oxidoreductase [Solirubrobacterales bacterium]|nr:TIGR03560 family F420-dependent LLM class oxidoreductase [Solirubrobacterales bacterium]